jgi:fructose/tagatose bisphosphate aldolase
MIRRMGIPTSEEYAAMLDGAAAGSYAYPAVNVTSSQALNAAIRGFAEAGSDGIVEVTTGAGKYLAGTSGDAARGARALAAFAHEVADAYPVTIALHTDHCPPTQADTFLRPLLAASRARHERGERPLFNSQMFDGSTLPLNENLRLCSELLDECAAAGVVLELECGVVGGEEDAVSAVGVPPTVSPPPPTTSSASRASSARVSGAGTCWRQRSATYTASTRRVTSSSVPRSCATARRRSPGHVRVRASITCFMGAADRATRTSVRRSPTEW